jgi:SAM-dependent methyltransferase
MNSKNEQIAADFNRLASAKSSATKQCWDHNNHYHSLMLQAIPAGLPRSLSALDVGCGTGELCRLLVNRFDHVLGVDLSENQLELARSRHIFGCDYQLGDFMSMPIKRNSYGCIVSVAAAHHLPYGEFLSKCQDALTPGGVLLVLDIYKAHTLSDFAFRGLAFLPNRIMNWHYNRHRSQSEAEKTAMREHCKHDIYMTMRQIREATTANLGDGYHLRRLLYFRYLLVYGK